MLHVRWWALLDCHSPPVKGFDWLYYQTANNPSSGQAGSGGTANKPSSGQASSGGTKNNILYSSQREIKVVLRSYTLMHNEELNCTYLNNSVMKHTYLHTLSHTPPISQSTYAKALI